MPEPGSQFIYTPSNLLGWALSQGWRPGVLPVGVIYTFQAPLAAALSQRTDLFAENTDLTVSNARMLMTMDDGLPVLVACLNPGAASMATQLEHLRFLGNTTSFAAIVGTAGALTADYRIGQTVIVESALRTDAISDRYLPAAPVVSASERFVDALRAACDGEPPTVRTWTVPVPYRSTEEDLRNARDGGADVVEMEIATLFAVAQSLSIDAAATVVISDVSRVEDWEVDWSDTNAPSVAAVLATIEAIRNLAVS